MHSLSDSLGSFFGFNEGLLGNEDAIKELTLVLASYSANLLDLRAAKGESSDVDSIKDELTLLFFAFSNLAASSHVDKLVLLATKEILNSDAGSILGNGDVDGEMSVDQSHLEAEALSDADDHVANVRFKRVDSARLLVAAKPDSNTDEGSGSLLAFLLHLLELTGNMRKVLGYFSSLALDSNFPCIHGCRNSCWDLNPVLLQHLPHF